MGESVLLGLRLNLKRHGKEGNDHESFHEGTNFVS